jgi:adenylate kinase family enzyme
MLIGFLGKKGVGKDTSAKLLLDDYNFTRYAFGDPVKDVVGTMFCMNDEQLYGNKKEEIDPRWNVSPRTLFQVIGTNFAQYWLMLKLPELEEKVKMKHFWVKRFEMWYEEESNKNKNVVITDVRFQHEVDAIKSKNGIIIKLINSDSIKSTDRHVSETESESISKKDIDYTIDNNSTIDELYKKINVILKGLNVNKVNMLEDETSIWGY